MKYKLGLNLGTNSLGWAIIELDSKNKPRLLVDLGSYIYTDGRVLDGNSSLCKERTERRRARKNRYRKNKRKKALFNLLIEYNLFPNNLKEQEELKSLNPYELRNKAISTKLKPYELGRALFHICQRRGFKSNRKSNKAEMKKLKPIVDKTTKLLKESNLTVGQLLYKRIKDNAKGGDKYNKNHKSARIKTNDKGIPINLYFLRQNYEDEFNKIREIQSQYHKLNEKQWENLFDAIFYQRELQPQECGKCTFLYAEGEKRIPKAYPSFQKFRILCDINNLAYGEKGKRKKPLTQPQRNKLFEILQNQKGISFSSINKKIGIDKDLVFNLETPKRPKLKGNSTEKLLSNNKYFGEKWFKLSDVQQDKIVEDLLAINNEKEIYNKAINEWHLTIPQAKNLASDVSSEHKDIDKGYGEICQKLIMAMLPYLEEGDLYHIALKKAGEDLGKNLHHSDFRTGEFFDELPYYGKTIPSSVVDIKNVEKSTRCQEEKEYGIINNPTVHIGLNRLRKIINKIIKKYGHPEFINIELTRDLGKGEKGLNEIKSEQAKNTRENERICKILDKENITKNRKNIQKYKLWEELPIGALGEKICPFSGKTIGIEKLFNSDIETIHILPYSRTCDDSMNNKTLAYKEIKLYKNKKSPYEAFSHSSSEYSYQDILDRIFNKNNHLNFKKKRWRFEEGAMEKFLNKNDFLARAINDTRYLSRVAKKYLSFICNSNNITTIRGQLTAKIRHYWGLNSILSDDNNKKNREDHRHHAIDAVVIALINRSIVKALAHAYDKVEKHEKKLQEPWKDFRADIKNVIEDTIVHHRPNHKIQGVLHKEKNYHIVENPIDQFNIEIKKPLIDLNEKEIGQIKNNKIREDLLCEFMFIEKEYTENERKNKVKDILSEYSQNYNIKNIKIYKTDASVQKIEHTSNNGTKHYKGVIPGKNHHISFWKLPKNVNRQKTEDFCKKLGVPLWISKNNQYCAIGINYFLINKYKNKKGNIDYNKLKPCPSAKLIMKLYKEDIVIVNDKIKKIKKLVPSSNSISLIDINNAEKLTSKSYKSYSFSTFKENKLRKVCITPLGEILDNNKWYEEE